MRTQSLITFALALARPTSRKHKMLRRRLLEYNEQQMEGGDNRVRERLADRMCFGTIPTCEHCSSHMELNSWGYVRLIVHLTRRGCTAFAAYAQLRSALLMPIPNLGVSGPYRFHAVLFLIQEQRM